MKKLRYDKALTGEPKPSEPTTGWRVYAVQLDPVYVLARSEDEALDVGMHLPYRDSVAYTRDVLGRDASATVVEECPPGFEDVGLWYNWAEHEEAGGPIGTDHRMAEVMKWEDGVDPYTIETYREKLAQWRAANGRVEQCPDGEHVTAHAEGWVCIKCGRDVDLDE